VFPYRVSQPFQEEFKKQSYNMLSKVLILGSVSPWEAHFISSEEGWYLVTRTYIHCPTWGLCDQLNGAKLFLKIP
jgi:hypothetical protein